MKNTVVMGINDDLKNWLQIWFERLMEHLDHIKPHLEEMRIKEKLPEDKCLPGNLNVYQLYFSNFQDYSAVKIMASDLIQACFEDQLYHNNREDRPIYPKKLNWTGSKVALIELIYALHYQGAFNNGNADIRLIAQYFENTFNVNLGNYYQTYLELRNRKMNPTKFLDALQEGLIRKMNEQDER